jgi:hypothetical protein
MAFIGATNAWLPDESREDDRFTWPFLPARLAPPLAVTFRDLRAGLLGDRGGAFACSPLSIRCFIQSPFGVPRTTVQNGPRLSFAVRLALRRFLPPSQSV